MSKASSWARVFERLWIAPPLLAGLLWLIPLYLFEGSAVPFDEGLNVGNPSNSTVFVSLNSFDANAKRVNASALVFTADPQLTKNPSMLKEFVVRGRHEGTVYQLQPTGSTRNPDFGGDPGIQFVIDDFDFVVEGNPTRFPFDSYHASLQMGIVAPIEFQVETEHPYLVPASYVVDRKFGELKGDFHSSDSFLVIDLSRPLYNGVLFAVITLLLAAFLAALWFAAVSPFGRDEPAVQVLGIGASVLALPPLRELLVPADLRVHTIFDIFVLLPFIIVALGLVAYLLLRVARGSK